MHSFNTKSTSILTFAVLTAYIPVPYRGRESSGHSPLPPSPTSAGRSSRFCVAPWAALGQAPLSLGAERPF